MADNEEIREFLEDLKDLSSDERRDALDVLSREAVRNVQRLTTFVDSKCWENWKGLPEGIKAVIAKPLQKGILFYSILFYSILFAFYSPSMITDVPLLCIT